MHNLFNINFLVGAFTCYVTGVFTFLANSKSKTNQTWFLLSICAGTWSLSHFLMATTNDKQVAYFFCYILYFSAIVIPSLFLKFILYLVDRFKENRRIYLFCLYIEIIFIFLLFNEHFIKDVVRKSYFNFYDDLGVVGFLFFIYYSIIASYAFLILIKELLASNGIRKTQLTYMSIAAIFGFLGGGSSFLLAFNFSQSPLFLLLFPFYPIIVTYAVIKYRFLDISILITRVSIFIFVYTLVLGIPFWLGFKLLGQGLWLFPIILMGGLATVGPFIFLFIQKRAEEALLTEQKRYQSTLRQASAGMGKVKDLKKLLNLIVYIVTRAVQIDHALIYIIDSNNAQYILGASKRRRGTKEFVQIISTKSKLIDYLLASNDAILVDELKHKALNFNDSKLQDIASFIYEIQGELLFPIYIDKKLIAIIVLGKKESGKHYSQDDISVFSILANQTALAIENAQFYEDMKKTQEQLFQAEKMATIGTMADGLSHQINNRFHAMGFISGDALDTLKMLREKNKVPEDLKETMQDLERSFTRIQENVVQGGQVVQGILKYTRKGDAGLVAVDFDEIFKSAFEMAQFKIKTQELKVIKEYNAAELPKIKGNFTQLQEVFFNMIDNAYDAMMQRKNEKNEPGYQATLTVKIQRIDNHLEIAFKDNGIGIKDEDLQKLFTPFFTTKLSSRRGTGLGLYVIKKIIEDNHKGSVVMTSQYMVGTQTKLLLPIFIE